MGLDQYLHAKKYTSDGDFFGPARKETFTKLRDALGDDAKYVGKMATIPAITVDVSVGYWRKANHIHQWFVDTCQDGVDDCRETWVGRERLEQLREVCMQVLADHSKADELLPTTSGFFFGSTEYDEWYFNDVRDTVDIIDNALAMPDEWDFYYSSSW